MIYETKETIRYSETGPNLQLTLPSLLDFFQDIATAQAEDNGIGIDFLAPQHLAWFLASWQMEVLRYPRLSERVIVGTFPYQFRGCLGYRNCYMKTESGEMLAMADSLWTMMDMEEGHMAKLPERLTSFYQVQPKLPMSYKGRKIQIPEGAEPREAFAIKRQHLDMNGHVNNGQYVRMAMEYVDLALEITGLRVEYKKQLKLDEIVTPLVLQAGTTTFVELSTNGGDTNGIIEIEQNGKKDT